MSKNWLRLSEVAKILGVHQSTVRSWADLGHLPVHRTQGGHRRFRRDEIELWMQARRVNGPEEASMMLNNAIGRIRLHISDGGIEHEGWYQKLDQAARDQYRRTSHLLLQPAVFHLLCTR